MVILLGPPGIDGKFGPYTESAVKQFQIDKGLKAKDGVAGPETWAAICSSLTFTNPSGIVKDTRNIYHQIDYVTPANLAGAERRGLYDPIELAQDDKPIYRQVQSDDFPAIDYEGLANDPTIKNATITPENMTEALPPSENMTEALPPSENMTEALPPSENMTEALPPSENMTEALPPSENMTEALPPSENMTEALPPSENMTEALPPSENMTEALPPSENMTEALPPSENMTEALPQEELLPG